MDKTLRTIREEIRKNREGIIPALTLVIDTNIFSESLPLQLEMSYYISKDSDYGLVFEDALVFSFVKLVGKALDGESKVLFLTKDSDFDVKRVLDALGDENVEIHFNSGECLQRVKDFLKHK